MLINEAQYQSHQMYSARCAEEADYFSVPVGAEPVGEDIAVDDVVISSSEKLKFLLNSVFSESIPMLFPRPLGVDSQTDFFLQMEKELELPRPNSHRYDGAVETESVYALSCYNKNKNKQVIYGSLAGTLPCYGAHVKLYKIETKAHSQTLFSPKGENIKQGEWALCPSRAEAYFGFDKVGAIAFHQSCIVHVLYLGPVSGILSKYGIFKFKDGIFDISPKGFWTIQKKNEVISGDWGGWAYALAAYYGLMN